MKRAFSLVELVFVIVIIGILAAVAIPKISATRDDAEVAATSRAIATAASEIAQYAISQARIENDMSKMSFAVEMMVKSKKAEQTSMDPPHVNFKIGRTDDCLSLEINDGVSDANLTLGYGFSNDALCDDLQTLFDASDYPIPLRGGRVDYGH